MADVRPADHAHRSTAPAPVPAVVPDPPDVRVHRRRGADPRRWSRPIVVNRPRRLLPPAGGAEPARARRCDGGGHRPRDRDTFGDAAVGRRRPPTGSRVSARRCATCSSTGGAAAARHRPASPRPRSTSRSARRRRTPTGRWCRTRTRASPSTGQLGASPIRAARRRDPAIAPAPAPLAGQRQRAATGASVVTLSQPVHQPRRARSPRSPACCWSWPGPRSCVAVLVAAFLAHRFTVPITRLTEASRRLAEGDLSSRVADGRARRRGPSSCGRCRTQFNQMADRLEESVGIIRRDRDRSRDFLADVSHELRTPIAAMRTFVELLQGPAGRGSRGPRRVPGLVGDAARPPGLAGPEPAGALEAGLGPRAPGPAPGRRPRDHRVGGGAAAGRRPSARASG